MEIIREKLWEWLNKKEILLHMNSTYNNVVWHHASILNRASIKQRRSVMTAWMYEQEHWLVQIGIKRVNEMIRVTHAPEMTSPGYLSN